VSRATPPLPVALGRAAFFFSQAAVARRQRIGGALDQTRIAAPVSPRAGIRSRRVGTAKPAGNDQNEELKRSGGRHGERGYRVDACGELLDSRPGAIQLWNTTG
jgi:hypothetical protein